VLSALWPKTPRHPTADGRAVGELKTGDQVDSVEIRSAERVPYTEPYTYDILADSESGAYFAGGVLIGSTLTRSTSEPRFPSTRASSAQ